MTWRFIDLDLVDPVFGAAVFEPMMDAVGVGEADDTVVFWRPRSAAIYLGFHQRAREDLHVDRCGEKNVPIVRRILGGGTGFCDPDQIIYNVVFSQDREDMPAAPRRVYEKVLSGVVEALRILGIHEASFDSERFSVYANGKKISGSGQLTSRGVVNSSGSFLLDFDFPAMEYLLTDPVKNLRAGVERPEDGMTTLRAELGSVSMDEAKSALREGFGKVLGEMREGRLTSGELSAADSLIPKYLSDEWIFRSDLRAERRKKR